LQLGEGLQLAVRGVSASWSSLADGLGAFFTAADADNVVPLLAAVER
jgi:hypothetical protein